jgi:AcrR family transcriptional regulator
MSLRETKKRETRAHISNTAIRLFAEHGFDHVTVAGVAAAANLSEKTIFNYFPTKEDLVFDLDAEMEQTWAEAASRGPGLIGLRDYVHERAATRPDGPSAAFRAIVAGSVRLQVRAEQMRARHEDAVAAVLANRLGGHATDPTPAIVAHQVLAIQPLASRRGGDQSALIDRAFQLIEAGLRLDASTPAPPA